MQRLTAAFISLLLTAILVTACGGNDQPSGPPPLTGAPSATAGRSATATPGPGTTLLTYHPSDNVTSLAWSPDGKRIATGSSTSRGGVIQIWDTNTGQQLLSFGSPMASIASLAWSPDGKSIVAAGGFYGGDNAGLRIWDASTGAMRVAIVTVNKIEGSGADFIAWSPDGSEIAGAMETAAYPTASNPNFGPTRYSVQLWDAATGKLLLTYGKHSNQIKSLAWSPDSKLIASASSDQTVQVWEAATGKTRLTYRGHKEIVDTVAWSPDGKYLASGGGDNTVQVWEAATGTLLYTYQGHTSEVMSVAWSPDSKRIVSASYGVTEDHPIQVWDALTGHHALDYQGLTSGAPVFVAWAPDGARIASAIGRTVTVWLAG
ncbi:MAG TPA: WD40 repeat domain-containing protein [Ktedonobacterales bacterium]|jgi:WD40 repeat protein